MRFWVTDNGDCHFRASEESLEKVTVVTSKPEKRKELSKSSKSSHGNTSTRFNEPELTGSHGYLVGHGGPARGARHSCAHFAMGSGSFKNGTNGKWPPREF